MTSLQTELLELQPIRLDGRTEALAPRVARLEREGRWLKLAATTTAGFVLIACALGFSKFQGSHVETVARAERFLLTGPDGKVRGELGIDADGTAKLVLYPASGKGSIGLGARPDGSLALGAADEQGKGRVGFAILPDGTADLAFFGRDAKPRVGLGITKEGTARLAIQDRNQVERLGLGVEADGASALLFKDQSRNVRAGQGADAGGNPFFSPVPGGLIPASTARVLLRD